MRLIPDAFVLQLAMGWEDCHMHDFRIGQKRFGKPSPDDRLMGPRAIGNEGTVRLFSVLGKVGAKAAYTYDFGDSWEHAILVEKILSAEAGTHTPLALRANVMLHPKIVAACQVSTTSWKRSGTRSTTNTRKPAIGWATTLIRRRFPSMRSTGGSHSSISA